MRAYLLIGVAALTLSACKYDQNDNADLTSGPPIELGLAPAYSQLPPAAPVPTYYAPEPIAYDYWNDAYDLNQSYYGQPPSYFNYGGATPLVWGQPQPQAQPQSQGLTGMIVTRIVEALVGGGQREYFYQPGYDQPFFIRDPNYAYALDQGRLVSVYDPYGQVLGEPVLLQQAPIVGRYIVRADDLRIAALRTPLRTFNDDDWRDERLYLIDRLGDEGWRKTWTPGANRSPVAIQRLAEVRARKDLRDKAHAAWKAELKSAPPVVRGKVHADVDNGRGPPAKAGPKDDHGKGPQNKADARDDHGKGPQKKADAAKDDHGKGPQKNAENDRGPGKDHGNSGDKGKKHG
ncbi:MAG TPA: hypothetical protein VF122_06175 [Caulobacteraceae bacterium]